ncbi:hypothetical protein RHGRI_024663 [Rhododendron griersonianum]|uniref:BHLH domain-containing protein n=1 Tax=Rhododendron griersonianum TaxID=479676 RepID=A0AAV6JAB0_9ERIC|nr:hypothetical protein RHGRI_024663 [Rhododendron griersonianum]
MLPRVDGMMWMQDTGEDQEPPSWPQNNSNINDEMGSLSTYKSMLGVQDEEEDQEWYIHSSNNNSNINFSSNFATEAENNNLLLHSVGSSSSCSPSSASVFQDHHYFLNPPPKPTIPSLLNNPLDNSFDMGFLDSQLNNRVLTGFNDLTSQTQMGISNLASDPQFSTTHLLQLAENKSMAGFSSLGFQGFHENSLFLNRSKVLKPLDNFASIGEQPTLFQKRVRKNLETNGVNLGVLGSEGGGELLRNGEGYNGNMEVSEKKRKLISMEDVDEFSIDGSGLNYDSDEFLESCKGEESGRIGGNSSNGNSTVTGGDQKGKKKGLPAKNLMAERRRRKKLNDRLYMLSLVEYNMDRASILGDAIEYLKELLQKINDLHNELESNPPGSSLTPTTTSFYPLTPTPPSLPCRIKEELCPSSLPSPNGQPARVEVRLREGRAVNIHMFCSRRPGLLLSTMRALDNLGLDIQQAVISCFNGFALDIFRAEGPPAPSPNKNHGTQVPVIPVILLRHMTWKIFVSCGGWRSPFQCTSNAEKAKMSIQTKSKQYCWIQLASWHDVGFFSSRIRLAAWLVDRIVFPTK